LLVASLCLFSGWPTEPRSSMADGYSGLRVGYFKRLQLLEPAVQATQAGVDEAHRLRNAIM